MSTTTLNPPAPTAPHPAPSTPAASARTPRRGDIYFIRSRSDDPDKGVHRAVGCEIWSNKSAVVVSNDALNASAPFVQVVYLTTAPSRRPSRLHKPVTIPAPISGDGPLTALALCEQIHPVDISRLGHFQGRVTDAELESIDDTIFWALGLEEPDDGDSVIAA